MKLLLTLAMTAASTTMALAGGPITVADDPVPYVAPAAAASIDWTGFYSGLSIGRSSGTFEVAGEPIAFDYETGNALGAFVGYNVQRGNLVYGGELAYSRVSDMVVIGGDGDDTLDSLLDVRGRLGFATGKALVYGAVGYSRGNLTINGTDDTSGSGASFGLGLDYQVSSRMFVGVDYTTRKLKGTNNNPSNSFEFDTTVNTLGLRVGLSF